MGHRGSTIAGSIINAGMARSNSLLSRILGSGHIKTHQWNCASKEGCNPLDFADSGLDSCLVFVGGCTCMPLSSAPGAQVWIFALGACKFLPVR